MWDELIRMLDTSKPSFTQDKLYDYESAIKSGVRPSSEDQHWSSRVGSGPLEGLILKSESHPTFWKTLESEKAGGYEMLRDILSGRLYSFPQGSQKDKRFYPYEDTQVF